MKLAPATVVLAACQTLRTPASDQVQSASLAGGFLAAGARAVIGTLEPVPDNDARRIFRAIHGHLGRGESASGALRQATLEAIQREPEARRGSWRAIAVLTTTIERP